MRIGILANSLPAALNIFDEAKKVTGREVFVLLCPSSDESPGRDLMRHFGRLILKKRRLKSLGAIFSGRVVRFGMALNHPRTIARLRDLNFDLGLHKSGNIYRRAIIDCFRLGILNAHIGLLPKYRGRSVMEWSLVQGDPVGISVFFIDEGIDTGNQIVLSETVDVSHCKSISEAKQYLFEQDARCYRQAIERINAGESDYQTNDNSGRRYYVMSRLFRAVAQQLLASNNRQSAIDNRQ